MNKSKRGKILSLLMALVLVLCGTPLAPVYGAGEIVFEEAAPEVATPGIPPGTAGSELTGELITAFSELPEEIRWQNTESPEFPETVEAMVEGNTVHIPVTWEADHDYDVEYPQRGLYVFTAVLGETYSAAGGELPRLTVYIPRTAGLMMMRMAGSGSSDSPLEITTAAQLAEIATLVNAGRLESFILNNAPNAKVNLKLMNNIDLSAYSSGEGWTSIGTWDNRFKGIFDGNGKVISGLYIKRNASFQGLFGYVSGGTIENLGLTNINIKGTQNVGGIAGYLNSGTVQNCYTTGSVGNTTNGGFRYLGGVVGQAASATVKNCYSTASVSGTAASSYTVRAGGVVGQAQESTVVENSYSTGNVSGTVSGSSVSAGGVVGHLSSSSSYTSTVQNCVALNSSISGTDGSVGRVVGIDYGTLSNNYAFSGMKVNGSTVDSADENATQTATHGESKNSTDIQPADFFEVVFNGSTSWDYAAGQLPVLKNLAGQDGTIPFYIRGSFDGLGTSADPYLIKTAADLAKLAELVNAGNTDYNNKHYKLENDLDLSAYSSGGGWTPIGTYSADSSKAFKGNFDGNSHVISGLYINRDADSQGLFGYINGATVRNLGVTNININIIGEKEAVGGVVGYMYGSGTLQNCYSTGNISGVSNVGGVVGYASGIVVQNCVALNSLLSLTGDGTSIGRVQGYIPGSEDPLSHNYAFSGISGTWNNKGLAAKDGEDVTAQNLFESSFWTTSEKWKDSAWNNSIWTFEDNKLPVLKDIGGQDGTIPFHIRNSFEGGGTSESPYLIKTAADLAKLAELVNDGSSPYADAGKYYQLENDIDLSAFGVNYDGGKGWRPIGTQTRQFKGIFNGKGKVISGLYIDRSGESRLGLFGNIDGGTVRNLGVTNVNIIGSYYVGGVVGQAKSGTVVENSYSTGSVSGTSYARLGGVVGQADSGTVVENCYSSASVSGSDSVGGVIGYVNGSEVQNCVALNSSVSLTAIATSIGRVAGNVAGTLSHNYAFSGISGTWNNKGLAAKDGADVTAQDLFDSSFWTTPGYWNLDAWNSSIWTFAADKLPVLKDLAGQSDDGGLHLLIRDIQYATVNVNGTYTYTGSPITPDLTVTFDGETLLLDTDYTAAITSIDESTTSAGTNAGVVNLTLTGQGNFTGTVSKEYTIAKAGGPAAPTGLAGAAPSSIGGADGKITGTTVAMEYARNSDFSDADDCTDSETVGLSAGTHYVRIKATANYEAGAYATVTVPEGSGGSGGGGGGGGGSQGNTQTTTVSGQTIDATTGEVLQGLTAQVGKAADGTAIVRVKSQEAVVFKQQDGTPSSFGDASKLSFIATDKDTKISLSADGTIEISNLAQNTQPRFVIQLDLGNNQKITIGYLEVKVDASGNVTGVSSNLIDPYGTIIDAATGEKIVGAQVTLYYADTERNKQKGIVAHTPVALPILNGFEPNNNKNPQNSDQAGFYAFMVYPEADYYLLASKEGYEDYKSMTISVEQEIVKWDFKMFKPLTGLQRLAGANRVDTALAIAKANYSGKLKNVVLSTADNYPDALAGSVLAYKLNAPILLVGSSAGEQQKVIDYLKSNLDPSGTVYILGGTGAVGQNVENKLKGAGFSKITRISGSNRSETALKIAEQIQVPVGRPVVLVNEGSYADALSISSSAAAGDMPIFLTGKDKISEAVRQKIAKIKPIKVYLIGGEGVLSAQVAKQVAELTGLSAEKIVRLSGDDRYETSLTVAKHFNLPGQSVSLATGKNFPDALAGGVFAANYNAPILLVNDALSRDALTYLESKSLTGGVLLGGEGVLSKQIEQELARLLPE